MRLIDADNINFHCNYDGDCTGDINDCKECGNYICDFRDIQEQPTAYDIDKVVEKLEEVKNKDTEIALDEAQKERCFWYAQGMNRAIEIVKGGGADDN